MENDTNLPQVETEKELCNNSDINLWHGVCRICAKYNDYVIPIFQDIGAQFGLAIKISMYFPFEIVQDDGLPQNCCHECASLIISWHDMVVLSEKAANKLNSLRFNYISSSPSNEVSNIEADELTNEIEAKQISDGFSELIVDEKGLELERDGTEAKQNIAEHQNPEIDMRDMPHSVNDENLDQVIVGSDKNVLGNEELSYFNGSDATVYSEDNKQKKRRTKEVVGLQAYKLHLPMKYILVNDRHYLRTKVFGFEPDNAPDGCPEKDALYFTCCICQETMKSTYVINHSKSHYPLKESDSCQACYFGFISIDCFRNHLKKHTVYIDEEYKQTKTTEEDIYSVNKNDNDPCIWEDSEIYDKVVDESDEIKNKEVSICEFCGMTYNSRNILLKHIRRIHMSPFLCKLCKKRFSNKSSLKRHRCILVVEKGPNSKVSWFNCKCKKIFLFEEQYLKHIETCEKSKYLSCHECGHEFSDKAKLDFHILLRHIKLRGLEQKNTSVWICEICGCHLSRLSAKKHYLTHLFMEKKFTCNKCDMRFIDKIALDKHVQTHSDLRPFSCEICKATFKRKDHVKMHMKNKHNISDDSDKKFQCRKCKRHFTTNSYLIRHQRLHSQGVSYECAVCKSRFPTEHSLKMHQTRTKHDTIKDKGTAMSLSTADWVNRYRCNICNQRYGSITSLKKHTTMIHVKKERNATSTNEPIKIKSTAEQDEFTKEEENIVDKQEKDNEEECIFQCPKCSKRYLSEFGLKLHLTRTKHAPVDLKAKKKPKSTAPQSSSEKSSRFKCNVCNENFSGLLNLKMHKIKCRHFSECPHCEKRFALDFKLRNHLIKVHNRKDINEANEFTLAEIRPYECNICHQKFAMNHNLIAHMQKKHLNDNNESNPISIIYIDSEIFNQKTADGKEPVVYHCTDCWKNYFTESDFRNHTHDVKTNNTTEDASVFNTTTVDLVTTETDANSEIPNVDAIVSDV